MTSVKLSGLLTRHLHETKALAERVIILSLLHEVMTRGGASEDITDSDNI
jgi:hypothetical protein